MEAVGRVSGALSAQGGLEAKLSAVGAIRAETSRGSPDSYDDYEGPYEVTPLLESQTLPTGGKLMRADVEVEEIPTYRTTNPGGGYTVVIAQG